MRKHEHRREQQAAAKGWKPKTTADPTGPGHQVLRLQRLAGNAAVTELLTPDRVVPRDAGRPLEPTVQREMEASLGHDFSAVRLHEDADAACALRAHAYTLGTDIVFAPGKYNEHRLAHELVHVVQQAHGRVEGTEVVPGVAVSDPSDHHEREADAIGDRVLRGENTSSHGATVAHSAHANIQRQEDAAVATPSVMGDDLMSKLPARPPSAPDDVDAAVVCKGGDEYVCTGKERFDIWLSPSYNASTIPSSVRDCRYEHERRHIVDLHANSETHPDQICAGVPEGDVPKIPNTERYECPAYRHEADCLDQELFDQNNPPDQRTREILRSRVNWIENVALKKYECENVP